MRIALALVLVSATAMADGEIRLDVELGKTVERDVAALRGWFCDDPSILDGALITRGERNFFRVTGVKQGTTSCRVGTDPNLPHLVFEVHVLPKRQSASISSSTPTAALDWSTWSWVRGNTSGVTH